MMNSQTTQPFSAMFSSRQSTSPSLKLSRPASAGGVKSTRPGSGFSRASVPTRPMSAVDNIHQELDPRLFESKTENFVSMKAHPMEVVSAYEKMLAKEAAKCGISFDLDVANTMGYEIQCLRKEKNKLENDLRLQKVETRKRENEVASLKRQLEQLARRPQIFGDSGPALNITATKQTEMEPSHEYVKALKGKLKELYDANQ